MDSPYLNILAQLQINGAYQVQDLQQRNVLTCADNKKGEVSVYMKFT